MNNPAKIPYLIIRFNEAISDEKLYKPGNNGRKVLVNGIYPDREIDAQDPVWKSGVWPDKTPVIQTGKGGVEVATFSQAARQDRHRHERSTECYSILKGSMKVRLNDGEALEFSAGDELVIFPGTVHEILNEGEFLARVHSMSCFGKEDKFVEKNGKWIVEK